jgi:hypothetical protein
MKHLFMIAMVVMVALMGCEKEPIEPDPPEPFNFSEYIAGSWDWSPYEIDNPEHWVFTFSGGRYSIEWYIADEVRTSNNPTFYIDPTTGVLTMQMASFYWYDYTGAVVRTDLDFGPLLMDVTDPDEMGLAEVDDPNQIITFTRL